MFWRGFGIGAWGNTAGTSFMLLIITVMFAFKVKTSHIQGTIVLMSTVATLIGLLIMWPINSYKKEFFLVVLATGVWYLLFFYWLSNLILPEFELGVTDNQLQATNFLKRLGISIVMTGLTAGIFSKIVKLSNR